MHRLMVTSATYRQSSTPPAKTLADDPDNTLFARMSRRRLEGEAVRDALLAVSGQLDRRVGGPSVFPDLPPGRRDPRRLDPLGLRGRPQPPEHLRLRPPEPQVPPVRRLRRPRHEHDLPRAERHASTPRRP